MKTDRKSLMHRPLVIALLSATALVAAPAFAQAPAPAPERREMGNQITENVPAIPASVYDSLRRYQYARQAAFEDWLPDGSMLILTKFGATNQLHASPPGADREQITFFDEPVASAQTLPGGGGQFVFGKDQGGDEWFQLHIADLKGGDRTITQAGTRNESPVFTPDGKTVVWTRQAKGSSDTEVLTLDLEAGGEPRLVLKGEGSLDTIDVSPDGRTALLGRYWSINESRRWLLDLASGKLTQINPSKTKIAYSGGAFARGGKSVVLMSDEGSDVTRLVEIDLASGKQTILTPDLKWGVEQFEISKDGRVLAYATNEDGYSKVTVTDFVTRRALPQPTLPAGVLTGMKFSPDGSKLGLSLTTPTSAGDAWSWDITGGKLERWTRSELGGLDPAALSAPDLIRFKSFDGLSVPAFVYRPKTARPGKLPVIIDIHGGPEAQTRPIFNPIVQHEANELGVAVILPNVRGSDGYGKAYLDLDNAAKREDSVKDIGALFDWIATQPDLDPSRVVVYGQSYGGYMSLAVMTHYSDRLAGGVERYGISNFTSFLKNTEAYRRDLRRAEYGDERDPAMAKVFERISPLNNVARINKPMLVMQGWNDPRVPKSESDQVVATLREKGVDTWYVQFKDEGHGFQKKPNNDLRRAVETMFMQKVLGLK